MFKQLLTIAMIFFFISTSSAKNFLKQSDQCLIRDQQCKERQAPHNSLGTCCSDDNLECVDLYAGWYYCVPKEE